MSLKALPPIEPILHALAACAPQNQMHRQDQHLRPLFAGADIFSTDPGEQEATLLEDGPGWRFDCPPFAVRGSVDDWADIIKRAYQIHTANVLAFARLIHASKAALKRGGWEQLFRNWRERGIPFGETTGKKWADIGEVCGQIGQVPDLLPKLPGGFEALYQLSRLGVPLLLEALAAGDIRPDLTEAAARAVVEKYRPDLKGPPQPFQFGRWRLKLYQHLDELELRGCVDELDLADADLRKGADRLLARAIALMDQPSQNGAGAREAECGCGQAPQVCCRSVAGALERRGLRN